MSKISTIIEKNVINIFCLEMFFRVLSWYCLTKKFIFILPQSFTNYKSVILLRYPLKTPFWFLPDLCHLSSSHFVPLTKVPHFGVTILSRSNNFRHGFVGNRYMQRKKSLFFWKAHPNPLKYSVNDNMKYFLSIWFCPVVFTMNKRVIVPLFFYSKDKLFFVWYIKLVITIDHFTNKKAGKILDSYTINRNVINICIHFFAWGRKGGSLTAIINVRKNKFSPHRILQRMFKKTIKKINLKKMFMVLYRQKILSFQRNIFSLNCVEIEDSRKKFCSLKRKFDVLYYKRDT